MNPSTPGDVKYDFGPSSSTYEFEFVPYLRTHESSFAWEICIRREASVAQFVHPVLVPAMTTMVPAMMAPIVLIVLVLGASGARLQTESRRTE